ncbi:hypothetical protein JCM18905_3528 [Vibrio sp. JCM 18905]|nr:hypothetical protein JCM18905_3528 [Vibrio sp. JCM 18905]
MTKFILEKTPLVMVLVDLRFTNLPESTFIKCAEDFEVKLFEAGLSISKSTDANQFDIKHNAADPQSEPQITKKVIKRFDYLNIARERGVTLTNGSLTFRSSKYTCFEDFSENWSDVLDAFFSCFKGIENAGMIRLGLRYMDAFITPKQNVFDFISHHWLSPQQLESDENSFNASRSLRKTEHGILRVELEERLPNNGMINTLPNDIVDPDEVSLNLEIKEHWKEAKDERYVIVDIDHSCNFAKNLQPLSRQNIDSRLEGLYRESSETFWTLLSGHAKEQWGGKKPINI